MLETPHVLVGAAIASKLVHPALAIPLSLASHVILDKIPHWNPSFYTETQKLGHPQKKSTYFAIGESVVALVVGSFISFQALPDKALALTIFFSCFASVIFDLIKIPYFFFKKRQGLLKKWVEFERSYQVETEKPFWGTLTQVVISLAALLVIYS